MLQFILWFRFTFLLQKLYMIIFLVSLTLSTIFGRGLLQLEIDGFLDGTLEYEIDDDLFVELWGSFFVS